MLLFKKVKGALKHLKTESTTMSVAKKFNPEKTHFQVLADIFINEMRQTGCSSAFLNDARPAIEKLFKDVEGENLDKSLDEIKAIILQQAQAEEICKRAKLEAEKLAMTQYKLMNDLKAIRNNLEKVKDDLCVQAINFYGLYKRNLPQA